MAKNEYNKIEVELLIDNFETDTNPKYYTETTGFNKRFHALGIITETIPGVRNNTRRYAVIFNNDDQIQRELEELKPDKVSKTYFERIDKIVEYHHNMDRRNSYVSLKGLEARKKDAYHTTGHGAFEFGVPLNGMIQCYGVYNVENGVMHTNEGLIDPIDLFQKIWKISNGKELGSVIPRQYIEVKDYHDIKGERRDERVRRNDRMRADLYKPIELAKKIPKTTATVVSNAVNGVYNYVSEKFNIKKLTIFASLIVMLVVGGAKGIKKYRLYNAPNGYDCFTFDTRFSTGKDQNLQIDRDIYASRIKELVAKNKTDLSQSEIKDTVKYLDNFVGTAFDNNASYNILKLADLVPKDFNDLNDLKSRSAQENLANTIQSKMDSCRYRPHPNNDIVEVNPEKGKEFLDFAIPLGLFGEEYVGNPYGYRNYSSANRNNPTDEQIRIYANMPDILKSAVLSEIVEVLKNVPGYEFVHPAVTPRGNASEFDVIAHLNAVIGKVNARILAQASDYVIEPGYRAHTN